MKAKDEWSLTEQMMVGDFNPYHDPKNGRFTTGSSVGAYASLKGKTENGQRLLEKYREKHKEESGPVKKTEAQERALKKILRRAASLKKEQYWIITPDGEIPVHKRGDKGSVSATVGEKREHLDKAISVHNHPVGGTFSDEDLNEFGFGATEMLVVGPDGVYSLANNNVGKKNQYSGWNDMREELRKEMTKWEDNWSFTAKRRQAKENLEKSKVGKEISKELHAVQQQWEERKNAGAEREELNKIYDEQYKPLLEEYSKRLKAEERRMETEPFHEFYKKNAKKYGFTYTFTEWPDNPYRALEVEE